MRAVSEVYIQDGTPCQTVLLSEDEIARIIRLVDIPPDTQVIIKPFCPLPVEPLSEPPTEAELHLLSCNREFGRKLYK